MPYILDESRFPSASSLALLSIGPRTWQNLFPVHQKVVEASFENFFWLVQVRLGVETGHVEMGQTIGFRPGCLPDIYLEAPK